MWSTPWGPFAVSFPVRTIKGEARSPYVGVRPRDYAWFRPIAPAMTAESFSFGYGETPEIENRPVARYCKDSKPVGSLMEGEGLMFCSFYCGLVSLIATLP